MKKIFNVNGICIETMHYMVDVSKKIDKFIEHIERGEYFVINKPRQYGKTTTLNLIEERLIKNSEYIVIVISFEGIGEESYLDARSFIKSFLELIEESLEMSYENTDIKIDIDNVKNFKDLSKEIKKVIVNSSKKVVLMIDEVDKSSNNQLFLDFLGMLRNKYLLRNAGKDYTFHSVILAGVHDVKTLKSKIRDYNDTRKYNSPWNIAADVNVDMSFSAEEIRTMLVQYVEETGIGMDIDYFAERLYYYTKGYPFLVSQLCKIIDEEIIDGESLKERAKENEMLKEGLENKIEFKRDWKKDYIELAVKRLLKRSNANFDSLIKNLEDNKDLYDLVYEVIIEGIRFDFNMDNPVINKGVVYGVFKNDDALSISNRIYEQRIYNYMTSKIQTSVSMENYNFRDNFINADKTLNLKKVLLKFQEFMKLQYSKRDEKFLERNGRLIFLAFLKPIINGVGFDFKEVQISEEKRLDVVITYEKKIYVIELKVWRGEEAHKKGLKQLHDYLDRMNVYEGYLLIYDFRKGEPSIEIENQSKSQKQKAEGIELGKLGSLEVAVEGKKIFEVIV